MEYKTPLKTIVLASALSVLGACTTTQTVPQQAPANYPDWVMNPVVENGIADVSCVAAKPGVGMNYLKSTTTALARAELAKQIEIKVKAMDKTYQRMADTAEGTSVGSTFESVSKQVTQKNLSGSQVVKMDYITHPDNSREFCVLMAMSPERTKTLFKDLIKESGNGSTISPKDESVLYEKFLAEQAQKELEAELQDI